MQHYDKEKEEENDGVGSFFFIKRDNMFMCLSTDQLKFLDMTNYIAPWFSYDKYLKAYGCKITKGFFPYEYMDCLERLDDTALPAKEAFSSINWRMRVFPTRITSVVKRPGAITAWRPCETFSSGTTTETWFLFYKPSTDSSPSTNNAA